jgi:GNAT superfamily N-acetyltransferase
MSPDGTVYRDFREEDMEWVLQAMVASMRATLIPERSATTDDLALLGNARADFDRYHARSESKDKLIIAVRGGERAGLAWITMERLHQDPGGAWLLEVFVEPRYRRQGLAKKLLDRAERWAREQGAKEIWLNVGGGNSCALGPYRSQGYLVETLHMSKRI